MAVPGIPLQIIGRELLVPLRISGTWRCPCPGTAAMVLLPTHGRSVVVRLGATTQVPNIVREVKPSKDGATPDGPLCWRNRVGKDASDSAQRYTVVSESAELPRILTAAVEMGGTTDPAGPVRGMWRARLLLGDDGPSVALARRVASYAEIMVYSSPKTGRWSWFINRIGKWYSDETTTKEKSSDTLAEAIQAAFGTVQGMVAEACVRRDTGRRLAYDPEWAAAHPRRERKAPADKVRRLAEKPPRQSKPKKPKAPAYGPNRDSVVAAVAAVKARGERPQFSTVRKDPNAQDATTFVEDADGTVVGVFGRLDQAEKALRAARLREVEGHWTAGRAPAAPKPPRKRAAPAAPRAPAAKPAKANGLSEAEMKASAAKATVKGWTFDKSWGGKGLVWRRADKLIALRALPVSGTAWQLQLADNATEDWYFMPGESAFPEAMRYAGIVMGENAGRGMPRTAVLPKAVMTTLQNRTGVPHPGPSSAPKIEIVRVGDAPKKRAKAAQPAGGLSQDEKDAKLQALFAAALKGI